MEIAVLSAFERKEGALEKAQECLAKRRIAED
jgi:hypothetical protein